MDGPTGSEIWTSGIPVYTERTPRGVWFHVPGSPVIGDGALCDLAAESILYATGPGE